MTAWSGTSTRETPLRCGSGRCGCLSVRMTEASANASLRCGSARLADCLCRYQAITRRLSCVDRPGSLARLRRRGSRPSRQQPASCRQRDRRGGERCREACLVGRDLTVRWDAAVLAVQCDVVVVGRLSRSRLTLASTPSSLLIRTQRNERSRGGQVVLARLFDELVKLGLTWFVGPFGSRAVRSGA